jgi:hypothetical protein
MRACTYIAHLVNEKYRSFNREITGLKKVKRKRVKGKNVLSNELRIRPHTRQSNSPRREDGVRRVHRRKCVPVFTADTTLWKAELCTRGDTSTRGEFSDNFVCLFERAVTSRCFHLKRHAKFVSAEAYCRIYKRLVLRWTWISG